MMVGVTLRAVLAGTDTYHAAARQAEAGWALRCSAHGTGHHRR